MRKIMLRHNDQPISGIKDLKRTFPIWETSKSNSKPDMQQNSEIYQETDLANERY